MSFTEYYEFLGALPTATSEELRRAYMKKALQLHPDKNKEPDAKENFQKLNHIYYVLKDPVRRSDYDKYGEENQEDETGEQCEEDNDLLDETFTFDQILAMVREFIGKGSNEEEINQRVEDLFEQQTYEPNPTRLWDEKIIKEEIEKLKERKALKSLYWNRHSIASFKGCVFERLSECLPRLSQLIISHNQLTSLPEEIGLLISLREIDVSCNKLSALPATLSKISNLEKLCLDHNKLKSLDPSLSVLVKLRTLQLFGNQISKLPDHLFAEMQQLQLVDLSCNHLKTLPSSLVELKAKRKNQLKIEFELPEQSVEDNGDDIAFDLTSTETKKGRGKAKSKPSASTGSRKSTATKGKKVPAPEATNDVTSTRSRTRAPKDEQTDTKNKDERILRKRPRAEGSLEQGQLPANKKPRN